MGQKKGSNSSGESEIRSRNTTSKPKSKTEVTSPSAIRAKNSTGSQSNQPHAQQPPNRTTARDSDVDFDWWEAIQAGIFASLLMFAILIGSYYGLRQYGYTQEAEIWIVDQVDRIFYPEDYARRMFQQRQEESYNRQRFRQQQQQQQEEFNRQWGGRGGRVWEEEEEEGEREEEGMGGDERGGSGRGGKEGGECVYECPRTRVCALNPKDCPCPGSFQTKCWTGDWYVCLEAPRKCAELA